MYERPANAGLSLVRAVARCGKRRGPGCGTVRSSGRSTDGIATSAPVPSRIPIAASGRVRVIAIRGRAMPDSLAADPRPDRADPCLPGRRQPAIVAALDLRTHEAVVERSSGEETRIALTPNRSVAEVTREVLEAVDRLLRPRIPATRRLCEREPEPRRGPLGRATRQVRARLGGRPGELRSNCPRAGIRPLRLPPRLSGV
jgi:hypothetical protein